MKRKLYIGILLMLTSSVMTCLGQLMWKVASSNEQWWGYILGFGLYAFGALVMMLALQFGELSVLHSMLSFGFVVSMFLGYFVLNENVSVTKVVGVILIILGLISMSLGARKKEEEQ